MPFDIKSLFLEHGDMKSNALVVGLRATKKEATKLALVAAALDLFEVQGFDGTSIDEIAAKAGVGRSTFFRYFETKEDVVLGSRWDGERLKNMLAERPAFEAPFQAVRAALGEMMQFFHAERARMKRQFRIIQSVEALRLRHFYRVMAWERTIAEFVAERRGTDHAEDAYAMACGLAGAGSVRAAFYAWGDAGARSSLPEAFEDVMDVFFAGLDAVAAKPSGSNSRRETQKLRSARVRP